MVPAFVAVVLMEVSNIPFPFVYLVTILFMGVFGIVFHGSPTTPCATHVPARHHRNHRRIPSS